MRELDESAVRSWARTALFDPFVTHMVVGQHWNSTPFPFGALYDARSVRANPESLFALMAAALLSSPSDMLRVLQVASTRYTGEKK